MSSRVRPALATPARSVGVLLPLLTADPFMRAVSLSVRVHPTTLESRSPPGQTLDYNIGGPVKPVAPCVPGSASEGYNPPLFQPRKGRGRGCTTGPTPSMGRDRP